MKPQNATLFDGMRLTQEEAIELTAQSLQANAGAHQHWAVAWSGGKDSTALWTMLLYLIRAGRIPRPRTFTVLQADTRMELQPLWLVAEGLAAQLREQGIEVHQVMAPLDLRYWVYILGRGVPPPNNGKLRWCTRQLKIDPMARALTGLRARYGEKLLLMTGLRIGESAVRDSRIALACNKDGGECGQGWYQETLPDSVADRLAPILHMRVCHVMDWLTFNAPDPEYGGWNTTPLVRVYGDGEARFGCMGCPLVQEDKALERTIRIPGWEHLAPLRRLHALWAELRKPHRRLRKRGGETRKDGVLAKGQQRLGPLTLEARLWGLSEVLRLQADVNEGARRTGKPDLLLVNPEEEQRIRALISSGTWPEGWTGSEPTGDELAEKHFDDGSVQELLWGMFPGGG
jgi:DNA sulfur modification protein DndC